jgi:pyrroline-5-carboxylate reductase
MSKIALIGAGRMGGALLSGWLASGVKPSDILIIDPRPGAAANIAVKQGAAYAKSLSKGAAMDLDVVILAIKPQMYGDIAPIIAAALPKKASVVSILAGTTQAKLAAVFGARSLIRAMPNTPAAIGKGITAYYANKNSNAAQVKRAHKLLEAGGQVVRVDEESLIDVVTAVSGSGPAYVFHLTETLEAAAIAAGAPADLAAKLARQTVIGSGALLDNSADMSATALRIAVTSPKGTTEAALEVLMGEGGMAGLMRRTVAAAKARSKALGK